MTERLTNQDISSLFTLMAVGREIDNTELEEFAKIRITGSVLKRLNGQELIESTRTGNKPYVHKLTSKGLARCHYELTSEVPDRPGYFGYALFAVFKGLDKFLARESKQLTDIFNSAGISTGDLRTRIRTAYEKLAKYPRDLVRLADLRSLLNGAAQEDIDGVLKKMSRDREANLVPGSNRKALTDADHRAALRIGTQDMHLLSIEPS